MFSFGAAPWTGPAEAETREPPRAVRDARVEPLRRVVLPLPRPETLRSALAVQELVEHPPVLLADDRDELLLRAARELLQIGH